MFVESWRAKHGDSKPVQVCVSASTWFCRPRVLTTSLWCARSLLTKVFTKYVPNIFQQRPTKQSVEAAIQCSCSALRMPALDMVQLHWWDYSEPGMVDVGRWLTELRASGKIKHVAVTNMNCDALQQLLDAGVPVVANQVQFSLLDRRPLNGMVDLCAKHGIKLLTYGTLAGGLLSDRYVAPAVGRPPAVSLNTSSLKMYFANVRVGGEQGWRNLLATLRTIADKHSVSVAVVALRWALDAGKGTVCPIIGMRNATHIQDNARALELRLDASDHAMITAALQACPGPSGDIYSVERS